MARENKVFLYGQVRGIPQVYMNKDGEKIIGLFGIKILRRQTMSQSYNDTLRYDEPIVRTKNPELINKILELKSGDMVDIKGVLTTANVNKKSLCPLCEKPNVQGGMVTYITPIHISRREDGLDDFEGTERLKANREVSNMIMTIGNLCNDPHFYQDGQNRRYAEYQIAVNRRYHIKEDATDAKVDYPWIKTFGVQAAKDSEILRTGSSIYIEGSLQTRQVARKCICANCNEEYEWNDDVTEIVPYYIGYLHNCNADFGDESGAEEVYEE